MITTKDYSRDKKLGAGVWATYRSKDSCNTLCGMYDKCYAKKGNTNIHFKKATEQGTESDATQIYSYLKKLPKGDKIRHHVAGDFSKSNKIDIEYVEAVIKAHTERKDLKGWTYTHSWQDFKTDPSKDIKSLTINASCDKVSDIKKAKDKGFDTVIVMDKNAPKVSIIEGERIVICPNQTNKDINCSNCMLCFKKDRNYTIGFRKH